MIAGRLGQSAGQFLHQPLLLWCLDSVICGPDSSQLWLISNQLLGFLWFPIGDLRDFLLPFMWALRKHFEQ